MASKEPLKYESGLHLPMSEADTINPERIPLSNDAGNLLENRADGLFYAQAAAPSLARLYVSSSTGDDSGAGTQDDPLETLGEALSRHLNAPVEYEVYLRAGETHALDAAVAIKSLSKVKVTYWDDPIYGTPFDAPGCPGYDPINAPDLDRPLLVFHMITGATFRFIPWFFYDEITFAGLEIQFVDDDPGNPLPVASTELNFSNARHQTVRFLGCDLAMPSYSGPIVARADVVFSNTYVTGDTTDRFSLQSDVMLMSSRTTVNVTPACGAKPGFTARGGDADVQIDLASFVGLNYDAPSKRIFNALIGWDLFP